MSESPRASIVIPTYNRPELLPIAVASALKALPPGGEVVVTDDGSDTPASKTLEDFHDPALIVTRNPGTSGAAANRNHGVQTASGQVVFFLDDDDLLFPSYVKRILSGLNEEPDATWGFSATATHTDTAIELVEPDGEDTLYSIDSGELKRRLAGLGCGLWIRRETFVSVGGIHEELSVNEDTDFCLTLLSHGHAPLYSERPGVSLFRRRRPTLTTRSLASERARCFQLIMDRHQDFLSDHPDGHTHLLRRYLKYAARARLLADGTRAAFKTGALQTRTTNLAIFYTHYLSDLVRRKEGSGRSSSRTASENARSNVK